MCRACGRVVVMGRKVKARIPLGVDSQGRWYAYGWSTGSVGAAQDVIYDMASDTDDNLVWRFVNAEIELPDDQEVGGTVENTP